MATKDGSIKDERNSLSQSTSNFSVNVHPTISPESIQIIAESNGVVLKQEVASDLAPEIEYRTRQVIQEAKKFMTNSRRSKLTCNDVASALKLFNFHIIGSHTTQSKEPLQFTRVAKDLWTIPEKEFSFEELLSQPLPKLPRDVSIAGHWLAIQGIRPQIPENQVAAADEDEAPKKKRKVTPRQKVETKKLVSDVLTVEQQQYYEKLTSALRKGSQNVSSVLDDVAHDAGLQPLLVYVLLFVVDEVSANLENIPYLFVLMKLVDALLKNQFLFVEPYLHQMMPPLLTCVLSKNLGGTKETDEHWKLRDYSAGLVGQICLKYGNSYKSLQPRVIKTYLNTFLDHKKALVSQYGAIVGLAALGHESVFMLLLPNITSYHNEILHAILSKKNTLQLEYKQAKHCFDALLSACGSFFHFITDQTQQQKTNNSESTFNYKAMMPDVIARYNEAVEIFGDGLVPYVVDKQLLIGDVEMTEKQ